VRGPFYDNGSLDGPCPCTKHEIDVEHGHGLTTTEETTCKGCDAGAKSPNKQATNKGYQG